MTLSASKKRLERFPSTKPSRLPAMDKSWQGDPIEITSTASIFPPSISVMDPRCLIVGKRFVVTRIGNGSISDAHIGSIPAIRAERGKPPDPSKMATHS